jgi:ribosome biogenesis GTPase
VRDEEGETFAVASGRLEDDALLAGGLPAVGDWVAARREPGSRSLIEAVLPRRTALSRKTALHQADVQVLAANVDTVLVVSDLGRDLNPRRIERYLALAHESGAEPVVVLTKLDLAGDASGAAAVDAVALGVPVLPVSNVTGEGLEALERYLLPARTVALVGSSGVGKSTLINALAGEELQATAEIRESDDRGRHTTVRRELIVLAGGGLVIDTPGMRELQLWESDEGMETAFADVTELMTKCRFRDCSHEREPGCAIQAALADGSLDRSRWESYLKLQREQRALETRLDKRLQADERKKRRAFARQQRRPKKY